MLKRTASHALHLLGEASLGCLGLAALAACALAWRLAQGPIDITALLGRQHPFLVAEGADLSVGDAALAWEGFSSAGQPLDIRLQSVSVATRGGALGVHLSRARVFLAVGPLLLGRLAPRDVLVEGARVELRQSAGAGPSPRGTGPEIARRLLGQARGFDPPPWLRLLAHLRIEDAALTVLGPSGGPPLLDAPHMALELSRLRNGGVAGYAKADILAGQVRARVAASASVQPDGTHFRASTTPVSLASLARMSPALSALAGADLPVGLSVQATLDPSLAPREVRLALEAGAGTIAAGSGRVAVQSATAALALLPAELRLDALTVTLAPAGAGPQGAAATGPVITARATATRFAGRIHATFGIGIDGVQMGQLGQYWPEGTGGGARQWLVQNVTHGWAHDAHVTGTLDTPEDVFDPRITSLAGGLVVDDATLFWLRPVPGLEHGHATIALEGPDSLRVTMDAAAQNRLRLLPGSFIRITNLEERHQFGDIDVRLAGPLDDALALLNHPRLHLLARSGLDIVDPAGSVQAQLTLHVPLEDRVTMDDIPIAATAQMSDVHLGRIAGGYDLDRAMLALKVDGQGLSLSGDGTLGGIVSKVSLDMDFRAGPPDQVLQHVTATGIATPGQLAAAGLPAAGGHILTSGSAALAIDYVNRRDSTATLKLDADLGQAALATPFGWSKPAGPPASVGARVTLDHGRLASVDHLHAQGPGLLVESRAELGRGQTHLLVLQRVELGRTRAHGEVVFPNAANDALKVTLSGTMLDLTSYLEKTATPDRPAAADDAQADDTRPGQPWDVRLAFDTVSLARDHTLSPFSLVAANDGLRISHAALAAGAPGQLTVAITPQAGGRHLAVEAADAGTVLRAAGVADNLVGGRLQVTGNYNDAVTPSALAGTAELSAFNMRDAPAIGRLLQAMTLYGLTDVLRGPGLHFSNMVAPFGWRNRVLSLRNARAFSPSLGITAQGDIDLRHRTANITGTLVPAYFFNQLLGDLPVVGQLFSPEKGGGVFAARYSVRGPLRDPKVGVNPLSALTPGFLREGFGLLGAGQGK